MVERAATLKAKAPAKPAAAAPAKKTPRPARAPRATRRAEHPADDDALAGFDFQQDSLGYALRRAQVHAYELFFEILGPLELSPARLTVLSLISMESELNQAALARRLNVAGPSIMKLIDALEAAGLIQRTAVAGDRRRYALVVTPAGRALLEKLRERLAIYEARLAAKLSAAERRQLMNLLQRLIS